MDPADGEDESAPQNKAIYDLPLSEENERLTSQDLSQNYSTAKFTSTTSTVLGLGQPNKIDLKDGQIAGAVTNNQKIIENDCEHIPCLYMPQDDGARKLIIYFHGNAEDIGLAFDLLYQFGNDMKMHILAVEYPGYGLYKTSPPDESKIKEDADTIFLYLTEIIGVKP